MRVFNSYLCSTIFLFSVASVVGTQCDAMDCRGSCEEQMFAALGEWPDAEADGFTEKIPTKLFEVALKIHASEDVRDAEKNYALSRGLLAFSYRASKINDDEIKNGAAQRLFEALELFENGTYDAQIWAINICAAVVELTNDPDVKRNVARKLLESAPNLLECEISGWYEMLVYVIAAALTNDLEAGDNVLRNATRKLAAETPESLRLVTAGYLKTYVPEIDSMTKDKITRKVLSAAQT